MKWLSIFLALMTYIQGEIPAFVAQDFSKAEEMAQVYDMPLVLVFTGSDWSRESEKLIAELLTNAQDTVPLKEIAVLVQIDFPDLNIQSGQRVENNFKLKERFHVRNFPTIVLLDVYQNEICRLGYPIQRVNDYVGHIKAILHDYQFITRQFKEARESYDEKTLTACFQAAQELGFSFLCDQIVSFATDQRLAPLLLLEKYAGFISVGRGESQEARSLRQDILQKNSTNREKIHSRLALLDYQIKDDVTPLETFLKQFESHHINLCWKIHLLISEHLFNENKQKEALEHARLSYLHAPTQHKQDASDLIDLISKKTH